MNSCEKKALTVVNIWVWQVYIGMGNIRYTNCCVQFNKKPYDIPLQLTPSPNSHVRVFNVMRKVAFIEVLMKIYWGNPNLVEKIPRSKYMGFV